MRRHYRSGVPSKSAAAAADNNESSEDDDDEDAFSALSKKTTEPTSNRTTGALEEQTAITKPDSQLQLPASTTSSMKRHHGMLSDTRKQKMDALLMELHHQQQAHATDKTAASHDRGNKKTGSFVDPDDEHVTTNLFIGNIAPSITEEQLTDLFRQFGDLYSVKIMWPRTAEERARGRHSGFVCFVHRQDAEDAMEACRDTDPFHVGRRLWMQWGKHVKKEGVVKPDNMMRTSTSSGIAVAARRKRSLEQVLSSSSSLFDRQKDANSAIRVIPPRDARRAYWISTVASFVAQDGSALEQKLLLQSNPDFSFLSCDSSRQDETTIQEHVYYKWRVYSFCQGDGFSTWRTEPFQMFEHGCFWIPPPVDVQAAQREEQAALLKEETIRRQKQERRFQHARRDYMTGRQLEQQRRKGKGAVMDGSATLDPKDIDEFNLLTRRQLCASREAICQAMSWCFEKVYAAKQVSSMLQDLLVESGSGISVETRIARLYLLSDILFNSQQPGVRGAFRYRDEIERMAPTVFGSFGKHGDGQIGRMRINRLARAVRSVLDAWASWNVYNPQFLQELRARFEGREIITAQEPPDHETTEMDKLPKQESDNAATEMAAAAVKLLPQGKWTSVTADGEEEKAKLNADSGVSSIEATTVKNGMDDHDGLPLKADKADVLEDTDGLPLDENEADGDPLEQDNDSDGAPLDENADGEPLDQEDDADGEPLEQEDNADGEPLEQEDNADGEPLEQEDAADGAPLDDNDTV